MAAKNQDFARAIEFLDFRNVKENILSVGKEELARQLYVVLGRTLWIDTENISIDPLGNMHEKKHTKLS